MKTPFFTVGIPTFNRASLLTEAIRAVLNQSCSDFELIIADNHSTDDTPQVVRRFEDARLKYCRHEQNLGPIANFGFLAEAAQGEFFVLNQDDDLLHRDFLKRCYEAVRGDSDVVMYAATWWRGRVGQSFSGKMMPNFQDQSEDFILNDRPVLLDGKRMAATLLHSFYFAHPAVALKASLFPRIGGYYQDPECVSDVITEARMLCHGKLVYDPRMGAIFRDHDANESRTQSKEFKIRAYTNMFHRLVADLDTYGVDWHRFLNEDLERYSLPELLKIFGDWVRYGAPMELQLVGWNKLWQRNPKSTLWLWKKLVSRVGFSNLLRFARTRLVSGAGTPVKPVA